MIPPDLPALAEVLAGWVDTAPGVPTVYLFESRVRGDHRPSSDVDLCLFQSEWDGSDACHRWWSDQSIANYADLKAILPGLPRLHLDPGDAAHRWVREALAEPSKVILRLRKCCCLWTPPKSYHVVT